MAETVNLPGGKSAVISLRMKEFRAMWADGSIKKLQELAGESGDLGEAYPLLAHAVKSWDCVDDDGNALDPSDVASYDELEPSTFIPLMTAVARYVAGETTKN